MADCVNFLTHLPDANKYLFEETLLGELDQGYNSLTGRLIERNLAVQRLNYLTQLPDAYQGLFEETSTVVESPNGRHNLDITFNFN